MSALHAHHDSTQADLERRRADLDHDKVAVFAMLGILALFALCFLGQSVLPL